MNSKAKALKMPAATETALRESIEKWKGIVNGTERDRGRHNCALCKRFSISCARTTELSHNMEKCPVFRSTGTQGCNNTAYNTFIAFAEGNMTNGLRASNVDALEAAKKEVDFLTSLLPKED